MWYKERKEVLIIMPAYNEIESITPVLERLSEPDIAAFADILVVNDSSKDGTNFIAKEYAETISNVYNMGYGSSLQLAYKYAIRRGYKYVIQMDSDGQHDPCNVTKIYNKLLEVDKNGNTPDIVLGARFLPGSAPFVVSPLKKFAMSYFKWLIKVFTGKEIADPTTGLQGLSRRVVLFYSKYNHYDDSYPDANVIMEMSLLNYRITEIPAVMHQRVTGTSMHSGLKPIKYMARMTLSMAAVLIRYYILKTHWSEKG